MRSPSGTWARGLRWRGLRGGLEIGSKPGTTVRVSAALRASMSAMNWRPDSAAAKQSAASAIKIFLVCAGMVTVPPPTASAIKPWLRMAFCGQGALKCISANDARAKRSDAACGARRPYFIGMKIEELLHELETQWDAASLPGREAAERNAAWRGL